MYAYRKVSTMANNFGPEQFRLMHERTQQMEPSANVESQVIMANHLASLQRPQMNQNTTKMDPSPSVQIQPTLVYNLASLQHPLANKRPLQSSMPKLKPSIHSAQQLPAANKRTLPMEPSPKAQSQSFESVRSKLRESLASALALVIQVQNAASDGEKMPENESASDSIQGEANGSQADSGSACANVAASSMPERPSGTMIPTDSERNKIQPEGKSLHENSVNENKEEVPKMWACKQEFQSKHIFPEDASFIIKDDLLQGNGLCWASDLDLGSYEADVVRDTKRPKLDHEVEAPHDNSENSPKCPEKLAAQIEEELFKFHGGVNKKYKEKGRSLLFNLKDRNNPELRERVMSGEIPPEKLCSMSAEDLASKELSQWRIAKAEELAQMVVLPDAEVDIRRLVRKTHKGEFQVEIEQDDSVSVEVAIGESSLAQVPSKNYETEAQKPRKVNETEMTAKVDSCPDNVITLTQDSPDLMQGLVVEDELKDTDFLPPIVSLDEFMDSLNAEPPFENLPVNSEKPAAADSSVEDEKQGITEQKMDSLTSVPGESVNISKANSITKADGKGHKNDTIRKSKKVAKESEERHGDDRNKIDHLWEGVIQFSVSSVVTVVGIYKSGEKPSTKEWANFLEIKGRVRHNAFGKFLQELPLSKSRAVMVGHFTWKEGSPESGRLNLSEAADSYISDERLGIAEPAPGVELYLCPPHKKAVEMLCNHLPKDHDREMLETIDSGLIGIVVWRRANVSSNISPKSSSHHKQNSRKHSSSLKTQRHEKDNTGRGNQQPPSILGASPFDNPKPTDDDEDVPPGFGPPVAREEDLPEFEFGRGPNSINSPSQLSGRGGTPLQPRQQQPTRAVEQMRELVHRYGQTEAPPVNPDRWVPSPGRVHGQAPRVEAHHHPWNDDDDDIPEWRPYEESKKPQRQPAMPNPPRSLQTSAPGYQQHMFPRNAISRSQAPQTMLQAPPPPLHVPLQHVAPQAQLGSQLNGNPPWQQASVWQQPYGSSSNVEMGVQVGAMQPPNLGVSSVNAVYRLPDANWRPRYP
ncbi:hypothetical protein H6P81_003855 [Aristolochia fimbriata]|uniref:TFIIS central domain-containing protein n=1 Tax=Aristolochia fimbriata TaxID=158543 RepID=A0AAV7FHF8_ARIFI|nr:hypothetical protein H6P81_003855 [Aristolochia fimbriata]